MPGDIFPRLVSHTLQVLVPHSPLYLVHIIRTILFRIMKDVRVPEHGLHWEAIQGLRALQKKEASSNYPPFPQHI